MKVYSDKLIIKSLDWCYDKAVNGIPGLDSAQEIGDSFLKNDGTLEERVNSLIRWQNAKSCTSGFLTGLGGILTMPITIPANLSSVLYVQIRMIAAIAYMGGYDLRDDKVKTLVYMCMAGNSAKDIVKDLGIVVGKKIAVNAIKSISRDTVVRINQRVGFRLLTKFGNKGVINLSKSVPLIGGFIGGTFDLVTTNTIGNIAKKTFIN